MSCIVKRASTYFSTKKALPRCLICGHERCPGCEDWCDIILADEDHDFDPCCMGSCIYEEDLSSKDKTWEYSIDLIHLDIDQVRNFLFSYDLKYIDFYLGDEWPIVTISGKARDIVEIDKVYHKYSAYNKQEK